MSIRGSKSAPRSGSKSEPRYARVPITVLHDKDASPAARIVFAEMALWVFQGTTCSIGQRAIAERLGLARNTVADAISQLIERGHIEMNRAADRGRRPIYILASPLFGQKQGEETVVVSSPRGDRRYASVDIEEVA